MNDQWFATLDGLLGRAWQRLDAGTRDDSAPGRLIALATVRADGSAAVRNVVIRRVIEGEARIDIQTDLMSAKVSELRAFPRAELLAWIPDDDLQIRASVHVRVENGPEVDPDWGALAPPARVSYGGAPAPGRPLDDPTTYRETAERDRFARLNCRVTGLDLVHLGATLHRRALFADSDGFAGAWVGP